MTNNCLYLIIKNGLGLSLFCSLVCLLLPCTPGIFNTSVCGAGGA